MCIAAFCHMRMESIALNSGPGVCFFLAACRLSARVGLATGDSAHALWQRRQYLAMCSVESVTYGKPYVSRSDPSRYCEEMSSCLHLGQVALGLYGVICLPIRIVRRSSRTLAYSIV